MVQLPLRGMGQRRIVPVQHPQQANGPQAVFLRFPARGQKAVHGPRASGGGAPPRRKPAPPARAEQGARGGRGRSAPTRTRRNSRGSTAPQGGTGHVRGRRISEGPRRGGGRGGRPLGGHSMPRLPQTGGLGGLPMWGDPPRATRLPAGKPGARGASRESDQHQASGERARRPGGEGAAAAALPGLCRAWLFRGELLLHPLRGGLAAGCSCAAAHPPAGYSWAVRSSAWEMMLHAASQPCT